jgi:hypothetical protein
VADAETCDSGVVSVRLRQIPGPPTSSSPSTTATANASEFFVDFAQTIHEIPPALDAVHAVAGAAPDVSVLVAANAVGVSRTFGGRRRSRLFICASQALFAVYTNQRGAQRP